MAETIARNAIVTKEQHYGDKPNEYQTDWESAKPSSRDRLSSEKQQT